MYFMNFEEGFNKILNSTTFWLDFDRRMVSLWFVDNSRVGFLFIYSFIFRVTERPATQTKSQRDPSLGRDPYNLKTSDVKY